MMGWLDGFATMPSQGEVTIPSVNRNFAYKLATSNTSGNGEYFIFECRSGTGWDAPLQPGLIVYHVDKSTRYSSTYYNQNGRSIGSQTGYSIWNNYPQLINSKGTHPCYYIVPAAAQDDLNYYGYSHNLPFPGQRRISQYTPTDWAGNGYGFHYGISFNENGIYDGTPCAVVTLQKGDNFRGISGLVTNTSGHPVEGATVSIYTHATSSLSPSGGIQRISGRIPGNLLMDARTDAGGLYCFELQSIAGETVDVEVRAGGYITRYESVTLSDELETMNFVLQGVAEPIYYTLMKFNGYDNLYINGCGQTATTLGSIHYTAEELRPYVGRKILSLSFLYTSGSGSVRSVYGVVDFGSERHLKQVSNPVDSDWTDVDLSGENLYIPAGKDCYFGFALNRCTYGYPLVFTDDKPQEGGANCAIYSSSSTTWQSTVEWEELADYGNLLIYVVLDDSSVIDYNSIANPAYGTYKVGDTFPLHLNEAEGDRKPGSAVEWFFDDEPVSGNGVRLKYPGIHVVEARFTTTAGKTKVVELEINVNP